jgi:MoaA/NifB/PqqE/SkfB family radical SAM enzyme
MYSPLRHLGSILSKHRPIQLTFFVTRKCNARCPFCFYLAGAEPLAGHAAELSFSEIERVSSSLGNLLWLAFSGGEIFLRKDIVEISRIFYERNQPAVMLYPTNGMLPELIAAQIERILRTCEKSVVAVKLSLDGVGEAHDALRGTPGGFAKLMQTYEQLAPLLARYPNFELGINTVFCRRNQEQMDDIVDFVACLANVRTHTLSLVRGDLADASHKQVDLARYERAIARLAARARSGAAPMYRFRGARLKAAQDILQRQLILRTAQEGRRLIPCHAGRLNLVLRESGEVCACETRTASLGNVRDHGYDLREVLRTSAAQTTLRAIASGECFCTHECYFITNILFSPGCYPALAREFLRLPEPLTQYAGGGTGCDAPTARTGS